MLYVHVVINVTYLIIILWNTIGIEQGTLYSRFLFRPFRFSCFAFNVAFSSHHVSNVGVLPTVFTFAPSKSIVTYPNGTLLSVGSAFTVISSQKHLTRCLVAFSKIDQMEGTSNSQEKLLQVSESHFRILSSLHTAN